MPLPPQEQLRIDLALQAIACVCRKYGVSEMAVFGSVLRDDFDPARSDVDFLVRFENNDAGPWMSKLTDLARELGALLSRRADVVDWSGVEQSTNPVRRGHILQHARRICAASCAERFSFAPTPA